MSGFQTHMLIGAAGGFLLTDALRLIDPQIVERAAVGSLQGDVAILVISAIAATWPDIDEPGSWMSRRVALVLRMGGMLLGLFAGSFAVRSGWTFRETPDALIIVAGVLTGITVGATLGWLFPRAVRGAAGGHRAGTHSLWCGTMCGIAGAALWGTGSVWWVVPAVLAWGWMLHLLGDIVTPAGWRPFAPLSVYAIRLPRGLALHGEAVIAIVSVFVIALRFLIRT